MYIDSVFSSHAFKLYRINKSVFSFLRSEIFLSVSNREIANLVNSTMENRIVNSHRTIETPQRVEFGAELCDELCLIEKKKKKDEYES